MTLKRILPFLILLIQLVLFSCNEKKPLAGKFQFNEEKIFSAFLDSLNNLNISSFDKANKIRSYLAGHIDLGQSKHSIALNYYKIPWDKLSAFECLELFQQNQLTAKCGLTSSILAKLYDYAGYKSFIYNCGFETPRCSHEFNLVEVNGKLIVEDAFMNISIVNNNGEPKDFYQLLEEIKNDKFSDIKILKQNTLNEYWIDSLSEYDLALLRNTDDSAKHILYADTTTISLGKVTLMRNYELLSNHLYKKMRSSLRKENLPDDFLSIYLKPLFVKDGNTGQSADSLKTIITKVLAQ